jgi:hypothetical protein
MRRIATALAAVLCLLPAATAEGKGIAAIEVCGARDCREVEDRGELAGLVFGGVPSDPPDAPAPWYRMEVAIHAEDARDRSEAVVVPSANRIRGEDGTWMAIDGAAATAFAKLVVGIEPRPASTLGDLKPPPLPPARVDEVVEPPASPPANDAPAWPWIAAAAAVALAALGAVALGLRRRRRLPPTAPAEG